MQIISDMHEWSKKPYSSEMSALKWAAFIGLVLVAAVFWSQIIKYIIG